MNKYLFFACALFAIVSMGCNRKYNRIIENKDKIVPLCYNKIMGNNPNRNFYWFETTNEEHLKNEYKFEKIEDKRDYYFVLERDSIQFSPDDIIGIIPDGSELYRQQICDYFKEMTQMMEHYNIHWFTDNNIYSGSLPGIIFGLDNGKTLEYRPGMNGDLESYRKLKDEWYVQE